MNFNNINITVSDRNKREILNKAEDFVDNVSKILIYVLKI
jgi:hypothetical protein